MPVMPFEKPRLPSNYYVWSDPPDEKGTENLYFVSEGRRITLRGHSFRDFVQKVVPLLDGHHSIAEIQKEVADVFSPEDLADSLRLLADQNLLVDATDGFGNEIETRMEPQLNLFHEIGQDPLKIQKRLAEARVAVIGLGGAGAGTALSLAAAGVGNLWCVDALPIRESDVYLAPFLNLKELGLNRSAVTAKLIQNAAPRVNVRVIDRPIDTEEQLWAAVDGSEFVVCCLDAGQSNLIYRLNRLCLAHRIRWTSCMLSGAEVILGPTVHPFEGPCYLCYRMRSVACAWNPEQAFAFERHLDHRKQDDSGRRENLVFGAGVAANLLGMEVVKELTGVAEPATAGKIAVFDLLSLKVSKHVVLRKPFCPACFGNESNAENPDASASGRGTSNA